MAITERALGYFAFCMGVLALTVTASCMSTEDCECMSSDFYITVGSLEIASIELSGPGCDGATILSFDHDANLYRHEGFVAGGDAYTVRLGAAGACTVTLVLADGTRREQRIESFYQGGSCCSGWYSNPESWDPS